LAIRDGIRSADFGALKPLKQQCIRRMGGEIGAGRLTPFRFKKNKRIIDI
jgi:hypothetical protein